MTKGSSWRLEWGYPVAWRPDVMAITPSAIVLPVNRLETRSRRELFKKK
jgi:hypothetical protein